MSKETKTSEENKIGFQELSDDDLDKAVGGKKVWIEPIKPQTN